MAVAIPVGLMSAIYLAEYAGSRVRVSVKPMLEILAGIPTVVYGFFAVLTVAPAIRGFGGAIGLDIAPNSALRSEEHTSELQSLMRISYAVFCLKKKKQK